MKQILLRANKIRRRDKVVGVIDKKKSLKTILMFADLGTKQNRDEP